MNKRKKVADAKHRARARKLEEKRKALKASGGVAPPPPHTPPPGPRAERYRRRPAGLTRRPATLERCRHLARTALAFSGGSGWLVV
jgi:hypothetical protein